MYNRSEIDPMYTSLVLTNSGEWVFDEPPHGEMNLEELNSLGSRDIHRWWNSVKNDLIIDRPEVTDSLNNLKKSLSSYMDDEDIANVENACRFAYFCHNFRVINPENRLRKNKTDHFITHPLEVARILSHYRLRKITIISALLHDVREDTYATPEELYFLFGIPVGQNVEDATKIRRESRQETDDLQLFKLYSCVKDIDDGGNPEAVLIKIADRLHNMRTIGYLDRNRRENIAYDTYHIYAPLADRLGLSAIAEELRYLSLKYTRKPADKALKEKTDWNAKLKEHPFLGFMEQSAQKIGSGLTVYCSQASITEFLGFSAQSRNKITHPEVASVIVTYTTEYEREQFITFLQRSLMRPGSRTIQASGEEREFHAFQFGDLLWNIRFISEKQHRLNTLSIADRYTYGEHDFEHMRLMLNQKLKDTREIITKYQSGDLQSFRDALMERHPFDQIAVQTPAGERIWINTESTGADFAFEIHRELLPKAIGLRLNNSETILPLVTKLSRGDIVEIVTNDTWINISAYLLVDGLTNRAAIQSFKKDLITIVERGKSPENYYLAMEKTGLRARELDVLGNERINHELNDIALRLLEELYRKRFGKEPEYDFSEVWDYVPPSFKNKFTSWGEFLNDLVLKEMQPRFINNIFNAFTAYEKTHIDTGALLVANKDGVIADFSSSFEKLGIGIVQIHRPVNDARIPKGAAMIRFLLNPRSRKREDVEAAIQELHAKHRPSIIKQ